MRKKGKEGGREEERNRDRERERRKGIKEGKETKAGGGWQEGGKYSLGPERGRMDLGFKTLPKVRTEQSVKSLITHDTDITSHIF